MSKSFKKQRRWDEYDDEDNSNRNRQDFKNRRREKKLKNDLRSWRNVSARDLQFNDED